jgi:hypothetical protein
MDAQEPILQDLSGAKVLRGSAEAVPPATDYARNIAPSHQVSRVSSGISFYHGFNPFMHVKAQSPFQVIHGTNQPAWPAAEKPVVVPMRAPSLVQQLQRQGSKAFDFAVKAKELGTEFGKHAVFDAIGVAPCAKASKWIGDYLSLFGYAFWVIFLAIFTYFWVTNFRNM